MTYGISKRDLDEITDALRKFPEIKEAVLFGSRAKGNYKSGSDIDIAIKGRAIDHACVSELSYILNEETSLPYFFDIVHYEGITEREFVEHIDRVGIKLFIGESV